jgi:hypothetical protein
LPLIGRQMSGRKSSDHSLAATGLSITTELGDLSSRTPRNEGCRRTPSPVQSLESAPIGGQYSAPIDRFSDHFLGQGPKFFKEACRAGLAGIVSKRADAPYRSGRGDDWLKTKCTRRQEFVIGGWRPSTAEGRFLASLLLGYYQGRELSCSMRARSGPEYASGEYRSRERGAEQSPIRAALIFFYALWPG